MPTTEPTTCEQVLLAWSPSNLLGNSGMGPVAASPGWRLSGSDPLAGLGESGRYLTEAAMGELDAGVRPPVALEFRPDADGALLVAKVYAAASRRAGHYQVHAVRVRGGGGSPWDLWAARDSGLLFVEERAVDVVTERLPVIELRPAPPPASAGDPLDTGPLSVLLQRLIDGGAFTVRSTDQPRGETFARKLLAYVPWVVSRGVPVTTLASEPSQARSGIALVVPPFSRGFNQVDVDLDTNTLAEGGAATADLAGLLISGRRAEIDALASLDELQAWWALRTSDLGALSAAEWAAASRGSLFPTLLELLAGEPRRGEMLLRLRDTPQVADPFSAGLRAHAPECGDLVAALFVNASRLAPDRNARVQGWLVDAVGPDAVARYVLRSLLAEASSRPVEVDSEALAEVLAASLRDGPELADFTFRTTTASWTAVTDFQVQSHLSGGEELPDGVRSLIRREPHRLARAIDQLVVGRGGGQGVAEALLAWPTEDVETLVEAVLASCELDPSWAVRVLERKPARAVSAVLQRHWPRIAAHLGIPVNVAERLEVRKTRWWQGE